jgi:ABC-type transporter Mla subunit MlaD
MSNENESALKAHLKTLHRSLNEAGEADEELQMLLRQLDGDIQKLLDKQADKELDANTYGLASRAQEITARFAVRHPRLEPTLRELGNILATMGI